MLQPDSRRRNDWLWQYGAAGASVQPNFAPPFLLATSHFAVSTTTLLHRGDLAAQTSGTIASACTLSRLAFLIDSTLSADGEEEIAEEASGWQQKAEIQPAAGDERPTPSSEEMDIPRMWCAPRMGR